MEVPDKPQEAILKVGFSDGIYGRSKGGVTFSGWKCEHLPYLVELDNWGASRQPGQAEGGRHLGLGLRRDHLVRAPEQGVSRRLAALRLGLGAARRTPTAILQMPGSRTMRSPLDGKRWYYANTPEPGRPRRARRRGGDPRHLGGRSGRQVGRTLGQTHRILRETLENLTNTDSTGPGSSSGAGRGAGFQPAGDCPGRLEARPATSAP